MVEAIERVKYLGFSVVIGLSHGSFQPILINSMQFPSIALIDLKWFLLKKGQNVEVQVF